MQVRRIVNVLAVGLDRRRNHDRVCHQEVRPHRSRLGRTPASKRFRSRSKPPRKQTRQNQARITQVDAKADQVGIWAKEAQTSATTANSAAAAASAKIDAVEAATKRLVYEVVISEDQGQFKFASAALPEAVQTRIDQMIADLKSNPRGNFVEIEGHTDSSGDKMVNQRIGEATRRSREALSLRDASGAAAQDERHQLGRRQARQPEQHARRPRAEPPGRHPRPRVSYRYDQGREQRAAGIVPLLSPFVPLSPTLRHDALHRPTIPRSNSLYSDCSCESSLSKTTPRPGAG